MATELTVVDLPDAYETDTALTPVDPGFVAADTSGNTFRNTGRELVLAQSTGGGGETVTVTSQAASRTGRLGDIAAAVMPASPATVAFQIFPPDGWASGGLTTITASAVTVELAVLRGQLQGAG